MELTILGSGTSIPSLRRGSPGYLVRSGGTLVLLDSGPATLLRIVRTGTRLEEISHVLFSHTHVDHTADLVPLLFTSRSPSAPRRAPLTIGGSPEFIEFFHGLSRVYGSWIDASTFPLTLMELGETPRSLGDLSLTTCRVPHIPSSMAIRLEDAAGRSLVYSGDTDESEDLAALAAEADTLLIEASFPDAMRVEGHLTPRLVGATARRARPHRVVLTHFYPPCDRADMLGELKAAWDGEALIAEDGMRMEI